MKYYAVIETELEHKGFELATCAVLKTATPEAAIAEVMAMWARVGPEWEIPREKLRAVLTNKYGEKI
jgi:hypothetical protein